jgi:hypothetical protein
LAIKEGLVEELWCPELAVVTVEQILETRRNRYPKKTETWVLSTRVDPGFFLLANELSRRLGRGHEAVGQLLRDVSPVLTQTQNSSVNQQVINQQSD